MKNLYLSIFMGWVMLFSTASFAQTPQTTVTDVKLQLIQSLQKDGYLNEQSSKEVTERYIFPSDSQLNIAQATVLKQDSKKIVSDMESLWTATNIMKGFAIFLFLSALIGIFRAGLWRVVKKIPTSIYQVAFLGMSLFGTFNPEKISVSQSFYVVLFCAFANIIIVGWIIANQKKLEELINKWIEAGYPVASSMCFIGMVYFGGFATVYHSSIFGFFAAICLSSIFAFSLYSCKSTWLGYFKENVPDSFLLSNVIVLMVYVFVTVNHIYVDYMAPFNAGIQYYTTSVVALELFILTMPWFNRYQKKMPIYITLFIAFALLAIVVYSFYDLKVMGTIMIVMFGLFVLEWISYLTYKVNTILGYIIIGALIYSLSLLLENYGSLIILSLN